ncbi:MAG TPA: DUF2520 domain-containing protein [Candidatus Saccharimonadales bacterium]|nr:DUF2520 domain-containing protein [Candidatus Saccharimonadales bacterium]
MRAWQEPDPKAEDAARTAADEATLAELGERGIDLDPGRTAARETGAGSRGLESRGSAADDAATAHGADEQRPGQPHPHPHAHSAPGEPPLTGIVGAGAVGTALGVALSRAGWPIVAVSSRDTARRERFRRLVPGVRAFSEANALLDEVELVILAVPDDALAGMADGLRLYSGQALVHTSGVLGPEVLAAARAAGTQIGAFHPLVAFAETERAVAALHGATIAVEGDDDLVALLADLAESMGAMAVRLAPGAKAAYHAAAVLAAGGVVALLDAIVKLARVTGMDEAGALAVYLPLVRQTLDNAQALGVRDALTGPFTRGDVGTLDAHLAELQRDAPDVLELYRAAGRRELALAEERGVLAPDVSRRLAEALAKPR